MARLPQAKGLRFDRSLVSSRNIEVHFSPSVAILASRVDKLGLDIRSFREPLHRSVKQVMVPSIRKNFDAGGRPKWQKLAQATIDKKGGTSPLIERGRLRRVASQINIWTITRYSATVRDLPQQVWYGKVHQAGAFIAGPDGVWSIPARPFIVLHAQDEKRIESVFRHWLNERIRRSKVV